MTFLERYLLNPHWRTVKIVGQWKIFGISATTILVVPLLSRILVKLNEMETTIRQSHPALDTLFPIIKLHYELPLSLKLVVGSAFFALLGKGIYEAMCPLYIKAGDSYEQFRHSQANAPTVLVDAFLRVMQGHNDRKKGEVISGLQAFDPNATIVEPTNPIHAEWTDRLNVQLGYGTGFGQRGPLTYVMRFPKVAEASFYVLRDVMDDCRRPARITCAVFYGVALVFLLWALCIQLSWAVRGLLL